MAHEKFGALEDSAGNVSGVGGVGAGCDGVSSCGKGGGGDGGGEVAKIGARHRIDRGALARVEGVLVCVLDGSDAVTVFALNRQPVERWPAPVMAAVQR